MPRSTPGTPLVSPHHASAAANRNGTQPSVSDDELRRCVLVRLSQLGPRISRRVQITIRHGNVRLSGSVSTDYERQFVRQVVERVAGIRRVDDALQLHEATSAAAAPRVRDLPAFAGRRQRTRRMIWSTAAVLLAAVTCTAGPWSLLGEQLVPLRGSLQVGGRPATGAEVTLHPLNRTGADSVLPRGVVAANGKIEWTTHEPGDGVPPGRYVVTIALNGFARGSARSQIAGGVYSRPESSPLRVDVAAGMAEPLCWSMP